MASAVSLHCIVHATEFLLLCTVQVLEFLFGIVIAKVKFVAEL